MDLRELLTSTVATAVGSCGLSSVDVHTKDCGERPLLINVKLKGNLSTRQHENIRESMEIGLKGTELENVPCLFTCEGIDIEVHGIVSNRHVEDLADRVVEKLLEPVSPGRS